MLVCGLYGWSKRIPSARLFVVAWSLFLVGAGVFALRKRPIATCTP
ncbi:7TM diverse intracellular signaling domain-containing protein [Halovibrio variabilis]|nr:7TM diverse intracellular signaling domain-containing protein [Halovibrio variabilis]